MKPRIGRIIYTIYIDQICEETVKFLGEDSFIVEHYEELETSYEFRYDEYNEVWFTTLSKAKAKVRAMFPNEKIKFTEYKSVSSHTRFWEATE